MAALTIPRIPGDILSCTALAWMRMTVDGNPATGMVVHGAKERVLIYINKDGVLRQCPILAGTRASFIDYLTQEESVTIFGEATERTEDDLAPMAGSGLPDLKPGACRTLVPDFVPYAMSGYEIDGDRWHTVNFPRTDGKRIGLAFSTDGRDFHAQCGLSDHRPEGSTNRFMRYLDDPSIDRWRTHDLLKSYKVVDPSTWPI